MHRMYCINGNIVKLTELFNTLFSSKTDGISEFIEIVLLVHKDQQHQNLLSSATAMLG